MKILVYGAGAVGGYLGGHLANAGHAVTLVVRQPVADAIAENGLSIQEDEDLIQTQPTATTSLRQALLDESAYDLILATMKAYDAEDALNQLVAFCPSPPPIITMQNGIGIEESFAREFGPQRVIAGSLTTPLSLETNSSIVVEHSGRGLVLAPVARKQSVKRWAGIFNEAGIQTTTEKSFESLKWSKALVNMIGNASSAILNRHPKVVYEYGPTFKLEMRMLKETLAVMRKKKIKPVDLPGVTTGRLVFAVRRMPETLVQPILAKIVAGGRGNKMPSFHIDLTAGKSDNEVLYHNGAVAQIGRSVGVSAPINAALTDILLKLARRELDYEIFNGNPKRLVSEVRRFGRSA